MPAADALAVLGASTGYNDTAATPLKVLALGDGAAFLRKSHHRGTTHLNLFGSEHDADLLLRNLVDADLVADGVDDELGADIRSIGVNGTSDRESVV